MPPNGVPQAATKRKQDDTEADESGKTSQEAPPSKKSKASPAASAQGPKPITGAGLSSLKKAKKDPSQRTKPVSRRQERTPPRAREPTPPPISRSPSRSPPRERKRPGVSGRIPAGSAEEVRKRQEERERAAREITLGRGGGDLVAQHYNAVPERGREWRQTGSRIKGLRSFNNWVKSALIQKFSPNESYVPGARQYGRIHEQEVGLRVLDIGCGKGGDLQKWQNAPQGVEVYVGLDPAAISVEQARNRYHGMPRYAKYGEFRGRQLYHAEFMAKDCFGESLEEVPIVREIGIDFHSGPAARGGGFDVVSMMFCMHYAFENEQRARGMLKNVSAALKRGGRFLGVIPNSDVLSAKVKTLTGSGKLTPAANGSGSGSGSAERPGSGHSEEGEWDPEQPAEQAAKGASNGGDDDWDPEKPADPELMGGSGEAVGGDEDDWDPEKPSDPTAGAATGADSSTPAKMATPHDAGKTEGGIEWGNSMYRVKFPGAVPKNGVFRPSYGWKYFFFLEEAVEEVPEFVVPWEAFRAMAIDYDLELRYRKAFHDVWAEEKDERALGELSERMGVQDRANGALLVSKDELEAASFYHAFCFVKT